MSDLVTTKSQGNSILRKKTNDIELQNTCGCHSCNMVELKSYDYVVEKMMSTLEEHDGLGIAAPQVGQSVSIIIAVLDDKHVVMYNPKITYRSNKAILGYEGCLSVPDEIWAVLRADRIQVEYMSDTGVPVTSEYIDDEARILQHEIAHLDGQLITEQGLFRVIMK